MKFNRRARLDTSQISDRRGMGPWWHGRGRRWDRRARHPAVGAVHRWRPVEHDPAPEQVQAQQGEIDSLETQCQTGADLEENPDCRFVFYVNSIQDYWDDEFARRGATYSPATTNFFTSAVQTGCGGASSQVGPFYCPADQTVYLDLGFFDQLRTPVRRQRGDFAEAYVLAHEYGHHIQNLHRRRCSRCGHGSGPSPTPSGWSCRPTATPGVWARHATTTDTAEGEPLITEVTEEDINEGLNAAASRR